LLVRHHAPTEPPQAAEFSFLWSGISYLGRDR
jgi:hypothetical protein